MKKIAIALTLALTLAACKQQADKDRVWADAVATPTPTETATQMAPSMTEEELDKSSADMVAQQEADEEAEHKAALAAQPFEYISERSATTDVAILRDKATGCEILQKQDSAYRGGIAIVLLPRPDGKGGIRGCGTGTDFKKGNK